MNKYKYANREKTLVLRYEDNTAFSRESEMSWPIFQEYLNNGGQVDPFKTRDQLEQEALQLLHSHHEQLLIKAGGGVVSESIRKTKLSKSLRKEQKGNADSGDVKVLDDNDLIDAWNDNMEIAMESNTHGEQWIEDPVRTEPELMGYDPSNVPWPTYPV